jgi:hypothetical protein
VLFAAFYCDCKWKLVLYPGQRASVMRQRAFRMGWARSGDMG